MSYVTNLQGRRKPVTLSEWGKEIHEYARDKGFWDERNLDRPLDNLAILMLVTTEVAEAAEAVRKGDEENLHEELADIVIRVLDYAHALGADLDTVVAEKMSVNWNRSKMHGKLA